MNLYSDADILRHKFWKLFSNRPQGYCYLDFAHFSLTVIGRLNLCLLSFMS